MSNHNRLHQYTHNAGGLQHLVGIGLDNVDGHKRLTQSENFSVIGGSQATHERMAETLIKTMEDIKRKGKELSMLDPQEVSELIQKNAPSY